MDVGVDDKTTLSEEEFEDDESWLEEQFQLNNIQANRRKALYQHMGSLRTNVDSNLTAAQKKEMRTMMGEARTEDIIKEKNSKVERRLER